MKPEQFKFLPDADKIEFIEAWCTLIAKRSKANHSYELYQYGEFYVELQVHTRESLYRQYFCFNDTQYLEPYLEDIDISNLYSLLY